MQIERARELGLCFGVRRALALVHATARQHGALETLGPIAHNRALLAELEAQGIRSVDSIDMLTGTTVVVSAHGVGPDVMTSLRERRFTIIDTTCPNVARAQRIATDTAGEGFTIVIFGDSRHTEVRGLLGWAGDGAIATLDAESLAQRLRMSSQARVGIIAQTTQRAEDFVSFVQQVFGSLIVRGAEIRILNTLCDATRRRQVAAAELARNVDAMVVIGSRASANTRRLEETCAAIVETYLVETAEELDGDRLRGKEKIGLTAGASTPDSSIENVEARLGRL
jgi:4-hydroxy-3-methylbut-2-enyl diphosphate reductase